MGLVRSAARRWVFGVGFVVLAIGTPACGGAPGASSPSGRCEGRQSPSLSESRRLPTGTAGGANAWFEVKVSWAEPSPSNNRLLLDGVAIPIVRVTIPDGTSGAVTDPTAGTLITRGKLATEGSSEAYPNVVSFRIPPGTPPGEHRLVFEACGVAAPESLTIEVLPTPAPEISSMRVVRGEQWPTLFIKGKNLIDAEEVVLVGEDGSVSTITNVTRIDDGEIRAPLDSSGTYEVFVRNKGGLGGGPPNGVVTVR